MELKAEILEDIRIDQYISKNTEYSRSKVVKMIQDGLVLVNGKKVKNSYVVKQNDIIEVEEPKEDVMDVIPENIPLDIV